VISGSFPPFFILSNSSVPSSSIVRSAEKFVSNTLRGMEGIKEATVNISGVEVKVAVAHGTGNAAKLLDSIRNGQSDYHFIEVMACPGGCINGGGQPIPMDKEKTEEVKKLRAQGLYRIDEERKLRKSHENPEVKKLYEEYLEKPNSHKAHHLLHTKYTERSRA